MIPGRLRVYKDVHFNIDAWITIYAAQRHPMYFSIVNTTERGSASIAEAKPPSYGSLKLSQVTFPSDPGERVRLDFRIS